MSALVACLSRVHRRGARTVLRGPWRSNAPGLPGGQAPEGFDAATLYAYSLLRPVAAARVRDAFPVLGSTAGLAAEATVCAQLLQTVARGDNLVLEDQLRNWAGELRHRRPNSPAPDASDTGGTAAADAGDMSATATWSGTIAFGRVAIPVCDRLGQRRTEEPPIKVVQVLIAKDHHAAVRRVGERGHRSGP
jgi:hypothetical protein